MYSANLNRNVTDSLQLIKIAKVLDTLLVLGRDVKAALSDIKSSYGLTKDDLIVVVSLIKTRIEA